MREDTHFRYNSFDLKQFDDLLNASQVLKYYEQIGMQYFHDFKEFMFMIFLLSYKIVLIESTLDRQSVNDVLIQYLQNLSEIQRLRLRTAGSKRLSYIAMKRLLDLIFEKSRGNHWLKDLTETLASFNDKVLSNENLSKKSNETDYSDLMPLDSSAQKNTNSIFETWMRFLKPEIIKQILRPEEIHAIERLLHLSTPKPILNQNTLGKSNPLIIDDSNTSLRDDSKTNLSEINVFMKDLLSELLKHKSLEKYANLHDLIQETLHSPLKDKTHSPITEWIEAINERLDHLQESDKNTNTDASNTTEGFKKESSELEAPSDKALENTSDSNFDETNDEIVGETLEEALQKTFEKRFTPILNQQFLAASQRPAVEARPSFLSDLENESTDSQVVISGNNDNTPLVQVTEFQKSTHSQRNQASLKMPNDPILKINALLDHLKFSNGLNSILEDLDQFDDRLKTLGIDHSSVDQMTYDEVISLYKKIKTPTFIKFINQVGRQKNEVHKIQASKLKQKTVPIDKIGFSNNIDLLISDEFINLSLDVTAFENDFYDRYLNDALLTIKMVGKSTKHKGPIILCYDGSGSMEGIKIEETRMHILSIIEIAKIQKRALKLIQFASASEPLYLKELNPLRVSAKDVLDILDTFICGGTDFEKPLTKAIEFILKEPHKNSDILFITDGQCEIKAKFKAQFSALKKKHQFKLYTLIMYAYTYHDYGDIGDISDAVLEVNERRWHNETNCKLYALL